jgi:hypothetical protein
LERSCLEEIGILFNLDLQVLVSVGQFCMLWQIGSFKDGQATYLANWGNG